MLGDPNHVTVRIRQRCLQDRHRWPGILIESIEDIDRLKPNPFVRIGHRDDQDRQGCLGTSQPDQRIGRRHPHPGSGVAERSGRSHSGDLPLGLVAAGRPEPDGSPVPDRGVAVVQQLGKPRDRCGFAATGQIRRRGDPLQRIKAPARGGRPW